MQRCGIDTFFHFLIPFSNKVAEGQRKRNIAMAEGEAQVGACPYNGGSTLSIPCK